MGLGATFATLDSPEQEAASMSQNASEAVVRDPVIAIYPGSFDPITNGHLDLIDRASKLVERLIVATLGNSSKHPLFSVAERTEMLREATAGFSNVEIDSFDGLLVDYAARRNANVIVRGIRAISDYEHELQMTLMNRRLRPQIDTIFLMAGEAYSFISSKMVKEVISLNGSITGLVPKPVEARLRQKILDRKEHNPS
jgi:pantetheine-phosphate adenylyltransferase